MSDQLNVLKNELAHHVVGQERVIERLIVSLLANGHCLLEGVPGVGKTMMTSTLAQMVGGTFSRIQFTPDLLPSDIVGTRIYRASKESFDIELGPIFANFVLADEINRAPAKVQSALLEVMAERQVTIGGVSTKLALPFMVLATQNPIEQEGVYLLPEAQRDRFLFNVVVGYPSREEEGEIIDRTTSTISAKPMPVVSGAEIIECQQTVRLVPLPEHVKNFVLDLVRSARPKDPANAAWVRDLIDWGPGPRACQQLVLAAKARALLQGRHHVTRDDVEALA